MTENEKQQLEQKMKTATPAEREQIAAQLKKLGGRRGAETRPRGKDAETR
jgi:hypothetical protein